MVKNELLVVGLETSGARGSAALLRGPALLGEEDLGEGTTHGVALHPALERLLKAARLRPADLGLVVVGTGPGSFTGMRVGVAAARALAFGLRIPVVGVSSFDALAAAAPADAPAVACVRDARKGEGWFALYGPPGRDGTRPALVEPRRGTLVEAAAALPDGALVLGEHRAALLALATAPGARAGSEEQSRARASVVARIGLARFLRTGAPDPESVAPLYLQEPLALRRGEGVRGG
jgi:tRNA threonylcarbamoyladenosine biosynthesis protein TsaB